LRPAARSAFWPFIEEDAMPAAIRIRARIVVKDIRAFGTGKADLLERIAAEGSISAAAKSMDMSYSRAWQLVDSMNAAFKRPLVESSAGGKHGGGATLTQLGEEVLTLFREMERRMQSDADAYLDEFDKRLK
jgi:molybdate transport system regulatory protein